MNIALHESWKTKLRSEFNQPYFEHLTSFLRTEYKNHKCYPPGKQIFAALDICPLEEVKVVIIGQDPYHGLGQANGLCFSVNDNIAHPPSLVNIFKEIEADIGKPYPKSGNLKRWAEQGVLLLNATLTVRAHQAASHQNKGWEKFTDAIITTVNDYRTNVVFLLWGGFAKKKAKLINSNKHHILTSGHPSPLSANRGYWFGNKHFSKTNSLLEQDGQKPILW